MKFKTENKFKNEFFHEYLKKMLGCLLNDKPDKTISWYNIQSLCSGKNKGNGV